MRPSKHNRKLQAIPLYKRIEQDIRSKVQSGQWKEDMPLPGRLKLAEEYGVALPTIERAIDVLIEDGVLRAESGRGTYVAAPPPDIQEVADEQESDTHSVSLHMPPILGIVGANAVLDIPHKGTADAAVSWDEIVISALERTFSKLGGGTRYLDRRYNGMEMQPSLEDALRDLLAFGVAAIAVVQVYEIQKVTDLLLSLVDPEHVPVVLLSWHNIASPLPYVIYDNRCAGYKAAQHLLQVGYQRLLYLDLLPQWWSKERLRGARAAVRDAHLPAETLLVYQGNAIDGVAPRLADFCADDQGNNSHNGAAIARGIMAEGFLQPTVREAAGSSYGVIAPTDSIALGFLHTLIEGGKEPGVDVGLIGFDDRQDASRMGLTTLRPPLEGIGEATAQLLMARLQGQQTPAHVKICSDLLIRSSTRRFVGSTIV